MLSPLSYRHSKSLMGQKMITALVIILLGRRSPSTIGRLIVAIIIAAFDRVLACGRFAHIIKKVLKCEPAVADLNSPTAVSAEGRDAVIFAPRPHVAPDAVYPRAMSAVSGGCFSSALLAPASTTTRRYNTPQQRNLGNYRGVATIALAMPVSFTLRGMTRRNGYAAGRLGKNSQFTKDASGQVKHCTFSHISNPLSRLSV